MSNVKMNYNIKNNNLLQRWKNGGLLRQDVLFIILLIGILILSFWKYKFGFGGDDEAFYQTIPYRLINGDAMFSDEWHLSQLSGFLLLPFTRLYTMIHGSTEGILLAARAAYILAHTAATIVIYVCIRNKGYMAMFGTVLYFIFTPFDIMALNYDSMGLELVTLTGILLGTADYDKKLKIILSGLCFFGAVLCNPYLAAVYFIYAICMVIHIFIKKKESGFVLNSKIFAPRTFLWFTVGAAAIGIAFLVFTLSRVSIADIFKNLPYMMKDPEHPSIPLIRKIKMYLSAVFHCNRLFQYVMYAYIMMLLVLIFDKKRKLHRGIYLMISAFFSIAVLIFFLKQYGIESYNFIMFAPVFVTVTSYVLCDKKPRELFISLFCLGIIYSVCIHCTSNQAFYVISMAMTAVNLAGFVFLSRVLREICETKSNSAYALWGKRCTFILIGMIVFFQGSIQIYIKATHVFWDASPKKLSTEITAGPAKGILTNDNNARLYMSYYNDFAKYKTTREKGNILFMTTKTWMYLAAEGYSSATFSAWFSGENIHTISQLKDYYSLNPEKVPKYIYIPKDSGWDIDAVLKEAIENGYTLTESDLSYFLEKK